LDVRRREPAESAPARYSGPAGLPIKAQLISLRSPSGKSSACQSRQGKSCMLFRAMGVTTFPLACGQETHCSRTASARIDRQRTNLEIAGDKVRMKTRAPDTTPKVRYDSVEGSEPIFVC